MALRHEAAETELSVAKKLPYMRFFVDDWLAEECVSTVSLAAQGLWINMLCWMWKSPARGELRLPNGNAMTDGDLAKIVRQHPGRVSRLREELEDAGAFDRGDEGVILCRRMVREQNARDATAARVRKHRENNDVTPDVTPAVTLKKHDIPIVPDSQSTPLPPGGEPPDEPAVPTGPSFLAFWMAYPEHRRTRQDRCKTAWCEALRDCGADPADIVAKAREYAKSPVGRSRYALSASKWLGDRCWLDDPKAWQDTDSPTGSQGRYIPQ